MPTLAQINVDIPNSGRGDKLRTAMIKINENFAKLAGEGVGSVVVLSGNATAEAGKQYVLNTSAGAITILLPATPTPGDTIRFLDGAAALSTYTANISPNGGKIAGSTSTYSMGANYSVKDFIYINSTVGWLVR